MTPETWSHLWSILQALVLPLVALVFTMLRREMQQQHESLRGMLTHQQEQRQKAHDDIHARVQHIERDLSEFKLNAVKNYLTSDDAKNLTSELRDMQRKLESIVNNMNLCHTDLTRELHSVRTEWLKNAKP
jgi:Na+/phosphate symporter